MLEALLGLAGVVVGGVLTGGVSFWLDRRRRESDDRRQLRELEHARVENRYGDRRHAVMDLITEGDRWERIVNDAVESFETGHGQPSPADTGGGSELTNAFTELRACLVAVETVGPNQLIGAATEYVRSVEAYAYAWKRENYEACVNNRAILLAVVRQVGTTPGNSGAAVVQASHRRRWPFR